MKKDSQAVDHIEERLVAAHRADRGADASPDWQESLMRRVRAEAAPVQPAGELVVFTQTLWRFAAAAGLSALLLGAYVLYTGFGPQVDVFAMWTADPVGFSTVQPMDL